MGNLGCCQMNSIKDEEKNESNGPLVSKPSYGGKEDSEEDEEIEKTEEEED